jgi:hypothetical protein
MAKCRSAILHEINAIAAGPVDGSREPKKFNTFYAISLQMGFPRSRFFSATDKGTLAKVGSLQKWNLHISTEVMLLLIIFSYFLVLSRCLNFGIFMILFISCHYYLFCVCKLCLGTNLLKCQLSETSNEIE